MLLLLLALSLAATCTFADVSINQNAPSGYELIQVSCYNITDTPTYTVNAIHPATIPVSYLAINESGFVSLAVVGMEIPPGQYLIIVYCHGDGSEVSTTTFTLIRREQNEFSPVLVHAQNLIRSIPENRQLHSRVVDVNATDSDVGLYGNITYEIVAGNTGNAFSIDMLTGEITVGNTLSYTTRNSYQLQVQAVNPVDTSASIDQFVNIYVTVNITAVPHFNLTQYSANVPETGRSLENQMFSQRPEPGFITVECTDADTDSEQISYSLQRADLSVFAINSTTGELEVISDLDYDNVDGQFYEFDVICSDGENTDTALIQIAVQPINEHTPTVSISSEALSNGYLYIEGSETDFFVSRVILTSQAQPGVPSYGNVTANDEDLGEDGLVTFLLVPSSTDRFGNHLFAINSSTGVVTVAHEIDIDATGSTFDVFTFRIGVFDTSRAYSVSQESIFMFITLAADETPMFSQQNYLTFRSEATVLSTKLVTATCTDGDIQVGEFSHIAFQNSSAALTDLLILNDQTGELTLNGSLDYETQQSIMFTLVCYDDVGLTATAEVVISVLPFNDEVPYFESENYVFQVSRTTPSNFYFIGSVRAFDDDLGYGSNLTYSLESPYFYVSPNTGSIFLSQSVEDVTDDILEYNITVQDDDALHVVSTIVVFNLTGGNYYAPSFTADYPLVEISELEPVGSPLLTLFCNDTEEGDNGRVSYNIVGGNVASSFAVDSTTGVLSVARSLVLPQNTTLANYLLQVRCTDHGIPALSDNTVVFIQVSFASTLSPDISNDTIISFVDEDASLNHLVVTITAVYYDDSELNFFFQNESVKDAFRVHSSGTNGDILVNSVLDRESISSYSMTVVAEATETNKNDSAELFIYIRDVNDNSPSCNSVTGTLQILETAPRGEILHDFNCTDADVGQNANLTYDIQNDYGVFGISSQGVLYLQDNLNTTNSSTFYLTVTVSDQGFSPQSITLTMIVNVLALNNFPPVFRNLPTTLNISESTPVFQLPLFTIQADDNDRGLFGVVRYALINQSGLPFIVVPNTGELYLESKLDFFVRNQYILNISATDAAIIVYSTLTINVLDSNEYSPVCTSILFTRVIIENIDPADIEPISLGCSDNDKGPNGVLVYDIISGNTNNDFSITGSGQVQTNRRLDYEVTTSYQLEILVSDSGSSPRSTAVTIHVTVTSTNEFTPQIHNGPFSGSIYENSSIGYTVLQVNATDEDAGDDGVLDYSLSPEQTAFGITNQGNILVTSELDRERTGNYSFTVVVSDTGAITRSASASVLVSILDIDDSPPEFTQSLYVQSIAADEAQIGSTVVSTRCTDPDVGQNAALNYSIVPSSDSSYFSISSDGDVQISDTLPVSAVYSFTVKCSGVLNPNLSDTAVVSITIMIQSNITFENTTYMSLLPENTSPVYTFLTVNATSVTGTSLSYSLVNSFSLFQINSITGEMALTGYLDYETNQSYVLIVEAADSGTPPNTAQVAVNIFVQNVNDAVPTFTSAPTNIAIMEQTQYSLPIGVFVCTDSDLGIYGQISYSISSGNVDNAFGIDETGGQLLLKEVIDYEETQSVSLQIQCADGGSPAQSQTATVSITIQPVNEHAPQFSSSTISITVDESLIVPTLITVNNELEATESDLHPHNQIWYSIIAGNSEQTFAISATSGDLTLIKALDYETTESYSLTVQADDSGGLANPGFTVLNSTTQVQIIVTDSNDNSPMFSKNIYVGSISESAQVGDYVDLIPLNCTDIDSGLNSDTVLTIQAGNDNNAFTVLSNGRISVNNTLDFEQASSYYLTVRCSDQGSPPRSDQVTVIINIDDVSEFGPIFQNSSYEFSVLETALPGLVVGRVVAVDQDTGSAGEITYTLTNSTDVPFGINPTNGDIFVLVPLDYETGPSTFDVTVTAFDFVNQSDATIVAITVINVDEHIPALTASNYYGTIRETSPPGTAVSFLNPIACSDADDSADGIPATFSLASSSNGPLQSNFPFNIHETTAVMTSLAILDLEVTTRFTFNVICNDSAGNAASAGITIDLRPYNDYAPVFTGTPYVRNISEGISLNSLIFTVQATDDDQQSYNAITYGIETAGNTDGRFAIDPTSGMVTNIQDIDYEEQSEYTLNISAKNIIPISDTSGSPSLSTYTTLFINITDLNDNSPIITPPAASALITVEDLPGTFVVTVTCTDEDSGSFGDTEISLTGPNANLFSLLANGTIVTVATIPNDLVLTVSCSDMGSPARTTTASITVSSSSTNDFAPVFPPGPKTFSVYENFTVGESIGCYPATDNDTTLTADGILSYQLTLVTGANHFSVISSTGCIVLVSALDYDDDSTYVYRLRAQDGGIPQKFADATIVINVINIEFDAPEFAQAAFSREMSEGTTIGAIVTQNAICTDRDDEDIITYTLVGGNDAGLFTVNSTTGLITLAATLDYETAILHSLTARCTDNTGLYDEVNVTITVTPVNEHTPFIISKLVSINEQSSVGTPITIIEYTDQDAGIDGQVTFEIIDPDLSSLFVIAGHTLIFNEILDREVRGRYDINLRVTDLATLSRSSTGYVNVSLNDINDKAPSPAREIYTVVTHENSSIGQVIETVSCTDADLGVNAEIQYSIEVNPLFTVNATTGVVSVASDLRFRSQDVIALDISCSDQGSPQLTTSFPLQVSVTSINEHAPVFTEAPFTVTLPENTTTLTPFANVTATDEDVGLNGRITYRLVDNFDSQFYINHTSGRISLLLPLDFETTQQYLLQVEAIDGSEDSLHNNRMTDTLNVTVQVTGVNEHRPLCTQPVYTGYINRTIQGVVLRLNCTDTDRGIDGNLSYSIQSGTNSSLFDITSDGGIVVIDPITPNPSILVYELIVIVADMGDPQRQTEIEVNLIYSFANLNSPAFNQTAYSFTVSESTVVGEIVYTVLATDADPGIQGEVQYTIENTDYFRVNPRTGEIFISEPLDWETNRKISFLVIASDSDPTSPRTTSVMLNATVLDENDNSPFCTMYFNSVTIGSSLSIGETIFRVGDICSDNDGPSHSVLSYEISPSSPTFAIDSMGNINVNGVLTPATTTALNVTVSDNGNLFTHVTVSVQVTFTNVQPPMFLANQYTFSVSEDANLLSTIGQVEANDSDSSSNDLQYSLVTSGLSLFYVDPDTGNIILVSSLNYEVKQNYTFTVRVEDSGSHNGSNVLHDLAEVTILVLNVNDNPPILSNEGLYGATVNKTTTIGSTVLTVQCTDDDLAPYGNPSFSQNGFDQPSIPFNFSASGGDGTVYVSEDLRNLVGSLSYVVNFTCVDQGNRETLGQVYLFVPDLGAPIFNATSYEWQLSEDTLVGETFTELLANSQDGSALSYSFTDGNTEGVFYINPNTGIVSLASSLDYESKTSYALVVKAVDGNSRESSTLLLVSVTDVDDQSPLVSPTAFMTVEQYRAAGYPVGTVSCLDGDSNSAALNYRFVTPTTTFTIDSNGVVYVNETLDETPVYVYPVACYDVSRPDIVSTGIVTIEVVFVNVHSPQFEYETYQVSVPENAPLQSLLTTVYASDADIGTNGQLTYSIIAGNPDKFYIDPQLGTIRLLTSLDRESVDTYTLTVQATDGGIGLNDSARNTATATVTITVLDINDNNPVFDQPSYVGTIYSNHSLLSSVLQVQCSDADLAENGTVTYSIDPAHSSFIIDGNGTVLLTSEQSVQTVHSFNVLCQDMSSVALSSSATATVVVVRVDTESPVFQYSVYSVTIPENQQLLDPFINVTANTSNGATLQYSITAGNDGNKFFIDPSTGAISVISALDYNQMNLYTLTVRASTTGFVQYSSYIAVTVSVSDVNDNRPYFIPTPFYVATVEEAKAVLTPVVRVNCSDLDPTNTLTYSINSSTPDDGLSYFNITSEGFVYATRELDYETITLFSLTVLCSDGATTPAEAIVQVNVASVNEFRPVFSMSKYSFSVIETESVGVTLGNVSATDDDAGIHGQLSYYLVDPGNVSAIFVDPTSGAVIVSSILDYETTSFYNLSVIARDFGGSETYVPVEITVVNIQDVPPELTPAVSVYDGRVLTNSPPGFFIESYTCTDQDGGSTSITISSGNDLGYFVLNSFNQVVWNESISLTSDVVVSLTLHCVDESNSEDIASLAIVVGPPDSIAPVFSMNTYAQSVFENATVGMEVLTVSASGNVNHTIEYDLVSLPFNFPFQVHPTSGVITVGQELNYESIQFYSFPIQATDLNDSTIALATVEITIVDINDNAPLLLPQSISLLLPENSPTDTSYAKFTCSDEDESSNNALTYFIHSGNTESPFTITSTGYVHLQSSLDYESIREYNITIVCSDEGSPPLSDSSTLLVQVSGVNEYRPQFNMSSYNFTVSEKAALSTVVGAVMATDDDYGQNGDFYFMNFGGSGSSHFLVDSDSGNISVTNALNASEASQLTLAVAAIDFGPPLPLQSVVTVSFTVEDVNERPYFDSISYIVSTRTDTAEIGDTLTTINCFDYDTGNNAKVTLEIKSNELLNRVALSENNSTGFGSISSSLVVTDTLVQGSHEVIVQCRDFGEPSLARNISVVLVVQGANTPPQFSSTPYGLSLNEDTEVGTVLLIINATDAEGTVTYALTGGTGLGTFGINPDNGALSLLLSLDYETTTNYILTVTATDDDSQNPQSAMTMITIVIANVNDHPPLLSPSTYTTSQMEGNYSSLTIQQFTCTDSDGGATFLSVSPSPPFAINSNGMVIFTGVIDYEIANTLTATIVCTDSSVAGADSTLSVSATLSITVLPVNFHQPVITSPATFNVSEGSNVGDTVAVISAYDPDMRGSISYQTSSHTNVLTLNSNTGELVLITTLDRETVSMYELSVTVSDNDDIQGVLPKTTTTDVTLVVTDINDRSPSCDITLQTITILAGTYNESLSLFNASCSDEDIGLNGQLRYSIVESSLPSEGIFSLDENDGTLVFRGTISKASSGNIISIYASDMGINPISTPALIQLILNVFTGDEPRFDPNYFNVTISEEYPSTIPVLNGSVLLNSLINVDGASVSFRFITNTTDFIIDSGTGDVFLLAAAELDYDEGQRKYSLGIQASINTELTEAILDIFLADYNDNPPVFTQQLYNGTVMENLPAGQSVLTVTANDIDSENNGVVRYSILFGNTNFQVNSISGLVTTLTQFDREVIPSYSVFIQAQDQGNPVLSSTVTVTIYIGDENDNAPMFQNSLYNFLIDDLSQAGEVLHTFSAIDPDVTGSIRYSLITDNTVLTSFLQLNSFTGVLSLRTDIPEPHDLLYTFKVAANDEIRTTEADVVLQIATLSHTAISLEENVANQTYDVFNFLQLSSNLSDNAIYTIISGDDFDQFDVLDNGILINVELLDRENISSYTLEISATDYTTNENSILELDIDVADKNDNPPIFNSSLYQINISEGHYSTQTAIGVVHATDADKPNTENSRVTYTLIERPVSSTFDIKLHQTTGELTVSGVLDRETSDTYQMVVSAEDHGEPAPLVAYATVVMRLSDINDNVPRFLTPHVTSFVVYYVVDVPVGSSPDSIVALRSHASLTPIELDGFHFFDPDSTDVAMASLIQAENMTLTNNSSPAFLVSSGDITYGLNNTEFRILLSDGKPEHNIEIPVTVMIIPSLPSVSFVSSTTFSSVFASTTEVSLSPTVTPSETPDENFINTPIGIATLIVATVMFFALVFCVFCVICFCCQYYQRKKDNAQRRPTSVFKRVESEGRRHQKKISDAEAFPSYQEFDQLDYPHYVPHDPSLGQMYSEYNEVETEFNDGPAAMPPMYPPPFPYAGYPVPYPPHYGMLYEHTPGTSMSELKPLSDEESDEDQSVKEERLKYRMGPLLGTVLEDFHRGDKILKDDSKKSRSSLLNLTGKSKK